MVKSMLALSTALTLVSGGMFHADLKSSIPAKDATVAAPKMVTLTFTEAVTLSLCGISIYQANGTTLVEKLVVKATSDKATITGAVTKPLAPGKYVIKWKNGAADDGHPESGSFGFTVAPK